MSFIKDIFQILFPVRCISCRQDWTTNLCSECAEKIECLRNNPESSVISAFSYKDQVVKDMIWQFKYKKKKDILKEVMPFVNDALIEGLEDRHVFNNFQKPILVPIPLHTNRYKERGYNQAEIIAEALFETNSKSCDYSPDNLIRTKDTVPQARLQNKMNRQKNILNAFDIVDPKIFHNRNIILVDDVTTTGATILEAKKTLRAQGARNVITFTIAK